MTAKPLLIATALIELGGALALTVSPALAASILIGAPFDTPADSVVGRVTGAALLALVLVCWRARNDEPGRPRSGIVSGILLYNAVVVLVLADARLILHLSGIGLWPAAGLHAVMAIWCLICLLTGRR